MIRIFGSRFPALQTNAFGACLFTIHSFTIRFYQTRLYVFMNESTGTLPHSRNFPLESYDSPFLLLYYYFYYYCYSRLFIAAARIGNPKASLYTLGA